MCALATIPVAPTGVSQSIRPTLAGTVETNCTLDTILRDARERVETDVAAILFGK